MVVFCFIVTQVFLRKPDSANAIPFPECDLTLHWQIIIAQHAYFPHSDRILAIITVFCFKIKELTGFTPCIKHGRTTLSDNELNYYRADCTRLCHCLLGLGPICPESGSRWSVLTSFHVLIFQPATLAFWAWARSGQKVALGCKF